MAVLRRYGDVGLNSRRLSDLPVGTQGRQRSAGEKSFARALAEDLSQIRSWRFSGSVCSRAAAAAGAYGSFRAGCRSDELSAAKISYCLDCRSRRALFHRGISGFHLWQEHSGIYSRIPRAGFVVLCWISSAGRGGGFVLLPKTQAWARQAAAAARAARRRRLISGTSGRYRRRRLVCAIGSIFVFAALRASVSADTTKPKTCANRAEPHSRR